MAIEKSLRINENGDLEILEVKSFIIPKDVVLSKGDIVIKSDEVEKLNKFIELFDLQINDKAANVFKILKYVMDKLNKDLLENSNNNEITNIILSALQDYLKDQHNSSIDTNRPWCQDMNNNILYIGDIVEFDNEYKHTCTIVSIGGNLVFLKDANGDNITIPANRIRKVII